MKAKVLISIYCLLLFVLNAWAQEPAVSEDSIPTSLLSSLPPLDTLPLDSLSLAIDSLGRSDSLSVDLKQIAYSKDSLDAPVNYSAVDSMIYDIKDEKIHLFGSAEVSYQTINLKADYIVFNWKNSIVTAEGRPDSSGTMAGFPVFKDGDQTFTAERMRYNFQTRKGVVYDVTTQQNDVIVKGTRSKFVSGEQKDSTSNDYVYSEDALFTTCTAPNPHFGIRSNKQKVIPNKLVVIGPSNLEIMDVPTPLWLPFGFFPISTGRRTGLLFPRDYEYSQQWGFGLREIGWFFPLGDHFNLSLTSNIYLKGTWGVNAFSTYKKRYKYNGNLSMGYDSRRMESGEGIVSRNNSMFLEWRHRQDATAHPTNTFGGSIKIQTNNYQNRVYNDERVLDNQLRSNLSFDKNWKDKPLSFSASFSHNQNTATRNVTINFPNLKFLTRAIYPFKREAGSGGGQKKWYEDITFRYNADAQNRFESTDTTLFTQETLDNAKFGIQQQFFTGTSFKVLKYFQLNPSVNYKEVWYFNSTRFRFNDEIITEQTVLDNGVIRLDTVAFGTIDTIKAYNFNAWRQYSASLSLNTQIFGTLQFKKGRLKGLRHVIKPSVSLNFSPDYLDPKLGYFDYLRSTTSLNDSTLYSIYNGNIFGTPPQSGTQMALSYSLNNIFEAKYFSRRDSSDKKIKLLDNLVINGSYNFVADSLKWSQISARTTARLFKGMTTVSGSLRLDPYAVNENGRRINQLEWKKNGNLLRFDQADIRFNTNITVSKIRALFQGQEEEVVEDLEDERDRRRKRPDEKDFLSLFENFRISHNLSMTWFKDNNQRDTFAITTNSVNFQGNIDLTDNWSIRVGSFGFDFNSGRITYPSFGFTRDLHCWQMTMSWSPTRGTYTFNIFVKPGSLDFIKLPYERNNADVIQVF